MDQNSIDDESDGMIARLQDQLRSNTINSTITGSFFGFDHVRESYSPDEAWRWDRLCNSNTGEAADYVAVEVESERLKKAFRMIGVESTDEIEIENYFPALISWGET